MAALSSNSGVVSCVTRQLSCGQRLPALSLLCVGLLLGCTQLPREENASKDSAKGDTVQPSGNAAQRAPTAPAPSPALPSGSLPAPASAWDDPLAPSEPAQENSAPTAEAPATAELPAGLYEYLTSVCGLRLPLSSSYLTLDSAIGRSEITLALPTPVAPGMSEFAREILISVSRKELFVNGYKVADIVCTTKAGAPCTDDTPLEEGVLAIKSETGAGRRHPYLILPLLKQLEYFQKGRLALLRHLDDKAYSWLLTCDTVSIAADRDVTFGLLSQVIHTAAMADLSRVRLVVADETETLSYIPLLSPRSSKELPTRMVLAGDKREDGPTDWPISWLAVSPSEVPEDFVAGQDPTLPECLPEVDWASVLTDRLARAEVFKEWGSHVALMSASHAAVLGLVRPESEYIPTPAAPASGETPAGTADTHGAQPGTTPPAGDKQGTADKEAVAPPSAPLPYLFVRNSGYLLALRDELGATQKTVKIPKGQPGELYGHLEPSLGRVLAVGPHPQLLVQDLVATLDTIRYRCPLYTMSGKCRRWDPFFPWVYLFVVPDGTYDQTVDRLGAMPAPVPTEATDDRGQSPAREGEKAGSDKDDSGRPNAGKHPAETP